MSRMLCIITLLLLVGCSSKDDGKQVNGEKAISYGMAWDEARKIIESSEATLVKTGNDERSARFEQYALPDGRRISIGISKQRNAISSLEVADPPMEGTKYVSVGSISLKRKAGSQPKPDGDGMKPAP